MLQNLRSLATTEDKIGDVSFYVKYLQIQKNY